MNCSYSIVTFRLNLNDPKSEFPFAMLMNGKMKAGEFIFIAYVALNPEKLDIGELGRKFLRDAVKIIQAEIKRANETKGEEVPLLEYLAQNNIWNLRISNPIPTEIELMAEDGDQIALKKITDKGQELFNANILDSAIKLPFGKKAKQDKLSISSLATKFQLMDRRRIPVYEG